MDQEHVLRLLSGIACQLDRYWRALRNELMVSSTENTLSLFVAHLNIQHRTP